MKIAASSRFTRVVATLFALVLAFMAIRGLIGAPEMVSNIREKAISENRSWIGSVVIGSAFLIFFCGVASWMAVLAWRSLRAPVGRLRFESTRFLDKFIGTLATLLFLLVSVVVAISWATAGDNEDVVHGWLTAVLLPSMLVGTTWLGRVVWCMFQSAKTNQGEQGVGGQPATRRESEIEP